MFVIFIAIYVITSKESLHKKFHFKHPDRENNIHHRYVNGEITRKDYLKIKHDKYPS